MRRVVKVLNVVLALILVSTMIVSCFALTPSGMSGSAHVERWQEMIRMLNTPMPILGAVTILLTFVGAFLRRSHRVMAVSLAAAALLLVGSGVITRFCNQPINATVMTWSPNAPPAYWESLRDQWWRWHLIRTGFAIIALALLFLGYRPAVDSAPARGTA
jgi:hypothetical protein